MSTTAPIDTLYRAIENLYTTFSNYKLRPHVEGCPCCTTDADNKQIHSKPLRSLTSDDLSHFAGSALTTWGDENDFRHFLPRLFELAVCDKKFGVDAEIVFGKLPYGKWRTWPQNEQMAIEEFMYAVWNVVLNTEELGNDARDWIACLAIVFEDMRKALDRWTQNTSAIAIEQFIRFVNYNHATLIKKRRIDNPFVESDLPHQQIIEWLISPQMERRLESVVLESTDEKLASDVSNVLELLRILRDRESARK